MQTTRVMRRIRAVAAGAAVVLLGACGTAVGSPSGGPAPSPADVFQLYASALEDAAIYEERDIVPLNGAQIGTDGTVRVVTLKSGQWPVRDTVVNDFVWVTLVPEVRDSCDDWEDADKAMRLRQLLGLQPEQPVAYFMEMQVPASALFRPTANPAITSDTLCNPATDGAGCALVFPAVADSAHYRFMVNQAFSSWKMPNGYPASGTGNWQQLGYPWTRLGYTYNWHPGSPRYGASEYVIKPWTRVTVTSTSSIAQYCGGG